MIDIEKNLKEPKKGKLTSKNYTHRKMTYKVSNINLINVEFLNITP